MVLIRAYCSSARVAFTQSENWGRTGTFASFHLCEKLGKRSVCPWFPCPWFPLRFLLPASWRMTALLDNWPRTMPNYRAIPWS